jgi:signal transduction histidine kinase
MNFIPHIELLIPIYTWSGGSLIIPTVAILLASALLALDFILYNALRKYKRLVSEQRKELESVIAASKRLEEEYKNLKVDYKELQLECDNTNRLLALEIHEQARLKEALDKARQKAEEADILKSNFLANMSHEIRTPMNGILGFAQLLKMEEMTPEKRDRYIDIINHNGTMLVNLIDDIVDISKIEAGQLAINKGNCNLDDLMFELYTFFNELKYKQEKEHITIRLLNLNDDESNVVFTDGQRLRQVMVNLIGNAIKFTDKGTVEFGYVNDQAEGKILFYVKDSGIGIPEDKQEIIFERFRQVHEGSTRKYGGTGIGLFISKHIISLLGGKIWFESKVNEGTTFFFTIPYVSVHTKDDNTNYFETRTPEYSWTGKRILVVEDVEINFKFLQAILSKTHAEIVWARDGEEAVARATQDNSIDLVLMDIQMPKINGYDATRQIRVQKPDLPIIAQTAYAMPNDNIRCIEAGCNDYISKPINSHLLLEKIDLYLNTKVRNSE